MENDSLAAELLHTLKASIKRLYIVIIIYDLWFRWKGNIQKSSWNIAKYSTTKYHLMYKGDLFLPLFYINFQKTLAFYLFMYYNIITLKKGDK